MFLGLSAPRVLKPDWLRTMADRPFILALANPEPEIEPDLARAVRPDAIIATGRSDYPNQVNNVLCFPFIFRGALDCGAREINEAMKVAAVEAIARLARIEASEAVAAAYGGEAPVFGPEYIIPKPFDPRLILVVAPAVARAAMESGVAERPITDFDAYREDLDDVVYRSGQVMRPVFEAARKAPARIAYAEGEDERTLRAAQAVVDDRIARPVLLGRRAVIEGRLRSLGLRLDLDHDAEVIDPDTSELFEPLVAEYQRLVGRRGMPLEAASRALRRRPTIAAAMLLRAGLVDAAVVGGLNSWSQQVRYVLPVIPPREAANRVYALTALIQDNGVLFFCDTHMVVDPTPEQLCEMTLLAADAVRMFGIVPRAAPVVALQLRRQRPSLAAQDAAGPGADPGGSTRPRGGRRDAGRHGAERGAAHPHGAGQHADRLGQPADHAHPGRRQHQLLAAEGRRRGSAGGPDPARRQPAGARADPERHRARHRQPHRADRRAAGGGRARGGAGGDDQGGAGGRARGAAGGGARGDAPPGDSRGGLLIRILVSAFEPFGGEAANASQRAVALLAARELPGVALHATVLPTCFGTALDRLGAAIETVRPDAVLAVGEAGGRAGLSVERVAINLDDARIADNAGRQPLDRPVVAGAPDAYFATLPAKAMVAAIRAAGLEASVSYSAGTFVCNHVFFGLRHLAETRHPAMRCGFVHVPWMPEQAPAGAASMPSGAVARGLAAALAAIGVGAGDPAVSEGRLW